MNIHPIFVHFPIALLTLYSVLELAYIKRLRALPYLFYTKAILVITGTIGAFASIQTGEMAAEGLTGESMLNLIRIHSDWANYTIWIYGILAASYLVAWLNTWGAFTMWIAKQNFVGKVWKLLASVQHFFIQTPFVILLALAGLTAVTITGALGGAIVYGPEIDPIVSFIHKLLVK